MFGISPPWYENDRMPFNFYAMSCGQADEELRQLAYEIRKSPDRQEELCQDILNCSLDDLSDRKFELLEYYVNHNT